jgi:hypothetical protein
MNRRGTNLGSPTNFVIQNQKFPFFAQDIIAFFNIAFTAMAIVRHGKSTELAYISQYLYRLQGASNTTLNIIHTVHYIYYNIFGRLTRPSSGSRTNS